MPDLGKAFVQIVPSAKGISGAIENLLGGEAEKAGHSAGLKISAGIAGALAAGTAAAGAFAAQAVQVGAGFDKAMSQVAATMGVTTDEIGQLRDFAQEMGATTAFSATQAAEALNYMALAGYDADTSMAMLPNVLNLAAAGSMDLARASDMLTDTQTAFGLSQERTTLLVDEMAKAASTGNTSVEQLGDAFLTVGGLVQELNGGFVALSDGTVAAVDGTQELEIALTAMANAGIKGSEAGTHMRNMLLKLADPTSDGAQALDDLNVEIFDAEGNMRSLQGILGDLSGAMKGLSQEAKIGVISDLFNARDIASAEALLNSVEQDWDRIGEAVLDAKWKLEDVEDALTDAGINWQSLEQTGGGAVQNFAAVIREDLVTSGMTAGETARDLAENWGISMKDALEAVSAVQTAMEGTAGAAQNMADTQLDNLAGDVTLLKSAYEGLQIAVSDQVTPALRDFAKFGQEALSSITQAISEGGLEAGFAELGNQLGGLVGMVSDMLPDLVAAGGSLVSGLVNALLQNAPAIVQAGVDIVVNLGNGLASGLPGLLSNAVEAITGVVQVLTNPDNLETLLSAGLAIIEALVGGIQEALPTLLAALPGVITSLVEFLVSAAPQIAEAGVTLLGSLAQNADDIISAIAGALPELIIGVVEALTNPDNLLQIAGAGIKLLGELLADIPAILGALAKGVVDLILGLVDALTGKDNGDSVADGGADLMSHLSDMWNSLDIDVGEIIGKIINSIGSYFQDIWEAGKNLALGLWDGVKSAFGGLGDWVGGKIDGMVNGVKDILQISSPSRVFADIGENMALGLGVGWADGFVGVQRDIENSLAFDGQQLSAGIDAARNDRINGIGSGDTYYIDRVEIDAHSIREFEDVLTAISNRRRLERMVTV